MSEILWGEDKKKRPRPHHRARVKPAHAYKRWTDDEVIEAIQEFARIYGRPPTANEWRGSAPVSSPSGDPFRMLGDKRIFQEDGCWPSQATVAKRFGSWSNAIRAAGFDAKRQGGAKPVQPLRYSLAGKKKASVLSAGARIRGR